MADEPDVQEQPSESSSQEAPRDEPTAPVPRQEEEDRSEPDEGDESEFLPRIPQRDEGGPVPPTPEEIQAGAQQVQESGAIIRDRHALKEYATRYRYEGEPTNLPGLGAVEPGTVDYRGVMHPEQLQAIKAAVEAGLLTKAGR